jgi:hypothetical protein
VSGSPGAAHVVIVSDSRAVGATDRVVVAWAPGETISPATDVMQARERLAALSLLSERAAASADRAEHALVAALRAHCAGTATTIDVIVAREGLSAVDRALEAFLGVQDAARTVTELTRSLGGMPVVAPPGSVDLFADPSSAS